MKKRRLTAAVIVCFLLSMRDGAAYIESLYSLQEVIDESTHIFEGVIESIDQRRQSVVARVERTIKGRREYERVQMNVGLGPRDQGRYLFAQIAEGDPFILFYSRQGYDIKSLCHAGDTWFQLFATHRSDWRRVWWRFTHLEIYMGRTFDRGTEELISITRDVTAGRRRAPPPNPRVPTLDFRNYRPRVVKRATVEERVLIPPKSTWRYFPGTREPSDDAPRYAEWRLRDFDDSSWRRGRAPFGYGDGPFGTQLRDMQGRYTTLFLRRDFEVEELDRIRVAQLAIDYDDGFIVWINGREAASSNRPPGRPSFSATAAGNHESGTLEGFAFDPDRFLVDGANTIAVQVFNVLPASSDLKLELELRVQVERSRGFRVTQQLRHTAVEPRGISWVDVNGDEELDAFVCLSSGDMLLVNEGGSFVSAASRYGLSTKSRAAAWADYNGDDHPDLVTNNFELWTNVGGKLERHRGLPAPDARNSEGAGWIDYNGDGRPDILITNGEHGIRLLENTGNGPAWFRDVSEGAGLGGRGPGRGNGDFIAAGDLFGDGFAAILYNLDDGVVARCDGASFRLESDSRISLSGGGNEKRGVTFADFDNDDDLDVLVPGPKGPRLYRNENDGTFVDVTSASGHLGRLESPSFSSAWGDVDHDGALDVFVCGSGNRSRLYLGDGRGRFRDATEQLALPRLESAYAASFADIDGDGDLDLAVNLKDRVVLLANDVPKKNGRAPLEVRLHCRRGVIGAAVRATDASGRLIGLREVGAAESCGGQKSPIAHFAAPAGACVITAILSDGRFARTEVSIKPGTLARVVLRDGQFD